jgi:GntR family transcriptional regulator
MASFRLDRRPLYAQAHDWLLTLVESGELQPGERLPSEARLATQLGISRATLREALRLLEEGGTIVRRQGVGTFVAPNHHLDSGLERLESVRALAARQGMETRVRRLSVESVEADRALAERLHIERRAPVTRVCRSILVQDRPVAYLEDFVPGHWLDARSLDESFTGSVLDLLRQDGQLRVRDALADITAVRAGRLLAQRLGVPPGAALLLLEEVLYSSSGVPLDYSRNYFVPDRFRFHIVRR